MSEAELYIFWGKRKRGEKGTEIVDDKGAMEALGGCSEADVAAVMEVAFAGRAVAKAKAAWPSSALEKAAAVLAGGVSREDAAKVLDACVECIRAALAGTGGTVSIKVPPVVAKVVESRETVWRERALVGGPGPPALRSFEWQARSTRAASGAPRGFVGELAAATPPPSATLRFDVAGEQRSVDVAGEPTRVVVEASHAQVTALVETLHAARDQMAGAAAAHRGS